MVPNISANGRSFRGAGAYHLHDKPGGSDRLPRTADRVAFTATRNLANEQSHAALDEMWRTAEDATHLKAAGGTSRRGRRNLTPVKTISLAWAPTQTPTRQEMTAAADDFLRAMGWSQHQALYVAHRDTAHPHLHIILNRVHPDTGRTLDDWQEKKRAQCWALGYEREHGAVLCNGRAVGCQTGAPAPAGLPYRQARLLAGYAKADRSTIVRAHRARSRPAWARHYRRQRTVLTELARRCSRVHRLASSLAREGEIAGARRLLHQFDNRRARTIRSLARDRAALARSQHAGLRNLAANLPRQAANDNRAPLTRTHSAKAASGLRFGVLRSPRPDPASNLRALAAQQRGERRQLLAMQVAASATTLDRRRAAADALALARSEIALAFAGRWAAIRKVPPALRAAATAALKAELAAALSARVRFHLGHIRAQQCAARVAHAQEHALIRRALTHRHRVAWTAAAAAVNRRGLARGPPPRSAASGNLALAAGPS